MPFASKRQEGYMWTHHPSIAQKWAHEFGSFKSEGKTGMAGRFKTKSEATHETSRSNESNHPQITKLPRPGGFARDFAKLKPSSSARHTPASKSTPNEQEAMKEGPVKFMPVHSHPQHQLLGKPQPHKGFHARDVAAAALTKKS